MAEKTSLTCKWNPPHDFVYFRGVEIKPTVAGGRIELAQQSNVLYCQCIASGPGRALPSGTIRLSPVKTGDYFMLNVPVSGDGNPVRIITEFWDDDGDVVHVVESVYIVGVRPDKPCPTLMAEEHKIQVAPANVVPQ